MTDFLGFGREKRRQMNLHILSGELTFRFVTVINLEICVIGVHMLPKRCLPWDVRERYSEWAHLRWVQGGTDKELRGCIHLVYRWLMFCVRFSRHHTWFGLSRILFVVQGERYPCHHCVEVNRSFGLSCMSWTYIKSAEWLRWFAPCFRISSVKKTQRILRSSQTTSTFILMENGRSSTVTLLGILSLLLGFIYPYYLSSGFGHDKSQAILPYRNLPNPPTLFFFGDGVSGK